MISDTGEILSRASEITWKHKVLWVFNLFPVLFSFLFVPVVFIPMFFIGPYALVRRAVVDTPYYLSLFTRTNLVLLGLSIFLYAAGSASTALGILRAEGGRGGLSFRELLQDGLKYFWRILGVTFLIGGATSAVLMVVLGCVLGIGMITRGLGILCLGPLFLILSPFLMLAYAWIEQSQAAVTAEDMGAPLAILRGWTLLRTHFGLFLRFSLVLWLAFLMLSLILALPLVLPFLFLLLITQSQQMDFTAQNFGWALTGLSLVVLPILALVQGVSLTFIKSVFMVIYLRLTRSNRLQAAFQ